LITAFAGYTAVYALNDIVDHRVDRVRLSLSEGPRDMFDVDQVIARHPLAQGMLPFKSCMCWFGFWAAVALIGAWWLNPVCAVIFVASALMEILYCKLLKITYLKIVPSAIVKGSGGLAGVFAVDPHPSPSFVILVFLWLAAWEVGGQNIANDIVDMEDDAKVSARTTLTEKGIHEAVFVLLVGAAMAVLAGVAIYLTAGHGIGPLYPVGAAAIGWILLLKPAREVYRDPGPQAASALFNRASYVPAAFLGLVTLCILIPH
jgi:4-hydroxybenzoate polyprenyltransferase